MNTPSQPPEPIIPDVIFNGRPLTWQEFDKLLPVKGDIWYEDRYWDECWRPFPGKVIFGREL